MKLSKRLLAIVLAAALLLGTVIIAAYADDDWTTIATTQADTKLAYTLTAPGLTAASGSSALQVKAGDTIDVYVQFRSNCYVCYPGGEAFFYTTALFNKINKADVEDDNIVYKYPDTPSTLATISQVNDNLAATAYPSGYPATSYTGLLITRATNSLNAERGAVYSDWTNLYRFTFTVKGDATVGTTGTIAMPQAAAKSTTNAGRAGMIYMQPWKASSMAVGTNLGTYTANCDLSTAILNFVVVDGTQYVDYTALETAKTNCSTLNPADAEYYDATAYAAWQTALADAQDLLDEKANAGGQVIADEQGEKQAAVDAAAQALTSTYAALVPAYVDLTALNSAVDKYDTPKGQLAREYYDATEYAAWEDALAAAQTAQTAYAGAPDTTANRDAVAAAAQDLKDAWDNLHPDYVDCTALVDAVADCGTVPYAESFYDAQPYAEWQTALNNAKAMIISKAQAANSEENRTAVANAATALRTAFGALIPHIVDTTPISEAIADCTTPNPESADYYDAQLYAAWQTELENARTALTDYTGVADTDENRQAVAAAAQALRDAFAALVPSYVDTTVLQAAIDANNAVDPADPDYYDATAYADWQNILTEAQNMVADYANKADTEINRNALATMAQAVADKHDALVASYVDLTALNLAIDDCDEPAYTEEYYIAADYAAYTDALAAAQSAVTTYDGKPNTEANRQAVATAASNLIAAYAALVPQFVDTLPLTQAITECLTPEYAAEYYDATAYAAWSDALDAAQTGAAELEGKADTAANAQQVATLATALNEAFAALVPSFVDYTALDEAIANYGTTPERKEAYTHDTYAAYEDALATATEISDGRTDPVAPASDTQLQTAIDNAAAALEEAYNALQIVSNSIVSIELLDAYTKVGQSANFAITVDKQGASKIQVRYNYIEGKTRTYPRDHASVVSITANEDSTETWVIAIPVIADEYDLDARAKFGKYDWDQYFCYPAYEGRTEKAAVEVFSAEVELTELDAKEYQTITVVTSNEVSRIRFVRPSGVTMTVIDGYTDDPSTGRRTWTITRTFTPGVHESTLYVASYDDNTLAPTDYTISFTVNPWIDPTLRPVSGDFADAVVSAEVSKARVLRDTPITFTVVTDVNAKGVKIVDKDTGKVLMNVKTGAEETEEGKVWTVTKSISDDGEYEGVVYTLYGSDWIESDTTVNFTVIY